jgi:hypothetical protein
VDGIKAGLCQMRSWRIEHVKRNVNLVAHTIAKEAILCVIDRVWVEETLNCICSTIFREQYAFR